ncbi:MULTISPECIES: ABC transporter permease [unclassified Imperialibacter]|uniref:ABC transporter permease n=1 Tax=unclassified Imperialibacter TaxID=2629706 RepID=UPI0012524713|nr:MULTISPECIES: ABC transporter permease [unclassified Imperialibacter]CAD5252271.1 FtsX-like permease family protein [Imperialibacter sp. 89]CAD5260245.1 FtsX-like permease family protein [Imperialibacter sp. 75]VVT04442.1 FtsX-like permease family protein [Imperialibacter sp. EC-SDR9]
MSKKQSISPPPEPPRWATCLLEWYCKPSLFEDLQGDLLEYIERNVESKGMVRAKLIYIVDVLKFFRLYTVQKPQTLKRMNQFYIFGNYVKTSVRSMARNRLFTTINVAGLAVSMSVGLLIIAFVSDLFSYDNFHENKDRTYRLIAKDQRSNGSVMELATTSVKAGVNIREEVPEIENLTIMRRGFDRDVQVADKVIQVGGFWADESFMDVFSFKLLKGNPGTALKEVNSLVLTETTARKLFDDTDVVGRIVKLDTASYQVTGVLEDIPKLSHIRFEALASFATVAAEEPDMDGGFYNWENIYMSHTYMTVKEGSDLAAIQEKLDKISETENAALEGKTIDLFLQPIDEIAVGHHYTNETGSTMNIIALWILIGLGAVVIISACFNYTNLSIARALRRSKEVGIRKVVGASKGQVVAQFLTESVLISLLALVISFGIFLVLKRQFLSLHSFLSNLVSLDLSFNVVLAFAAFAIVTGIVAGLLPAIFFAKIRSLAVLKGASAILSSKRLGLRRGLIVVQYVFSLIFITTTLIGYVQYKGMLSYDLGFSTSNIVNIRLQNNKPEIVEARMAALPEVEQISKSAMVTSLGSTWGTQAKYQEDSGFVWQNGINEQYLPLHRHTLLAGRNFEAKAQSAAETEVIVNEKLLARFNIAQDNVAEAVGEVLTIEGKRLTIIGVVKDFHYETLEDPIEPTVLRYESQPGGYLNVKVNTTDLSATIASLELAWDEIDPVHPMDAKFYDEQIEQAYSQFSVMLKVIGFLAFLAVCIASMGLFGMVVFATETRLKEISIRKVLGAGEGSLIYLLGRGFLWLLGIATAIALPVTYLFFDQVVLAQFAFHAPIGFTELFGGVAVVLVIAFLMIVSQTMKAAGTNPAQILRNE